MFNTITSALGQAYTKESQDVILRPGQVVQGKVIELLPNNTAIVQINNTTMTAKVEANLSGQGNHFFQVGKSEDGTLVLKVVDGNKGLQNQANLEAILKQLGVATTTDNKQLVTLLVKNKLPVTKDIINQLSTLFKDVKLGKQEFQALDTMMKKDLPLTETTLKSVVAYQQGKPIQQDISELMKTLATTQNLPQTVQKLQSFMMNQYVSNKEVAFAKLAGSLVQGNQKEVVASILQKIGITLNQESTSVQKSTAEEIKGMTKEKPSLLLQRIENVEVKSVKQPLGAQNGNESLKAIIPLIEKQISIPKAMDAKYIIGQLSTLLKDIKLGKHELQALDTMIKKDFPLTETTLKSVVAHQQGKLIQQDISGLIKTLATTQNLPQTVQKLQNLMMNQNVSDKEVAFAKLVGRLVQGNQKEVAASILQKIENMLEKNIAKEGINVEVKSVKQPLGAQNGNESLKAIIPLIEKQISIPKAMDALEKLLVNQRGSLTKEEAVLVTKVLTEASALSGGKEIGVTLKQMFTSLGLQFEHGMSGKSNKMDQMETLKPLLMNALDEMTSPRLKEQAESMILRLTGQQLLSQETSGPLLHVATQIPFMMNNALRELNIQWSGRETEEGQIDANFCRIFFYLDLEAIMETGIDVHIQNRVVNITILNGSDGLETMVHRGQEKIAEKLAEMNYQLSSMKVSPFTKKEAVKQVRTNETEIKKYHGVDLHI